MDQIETLTLSLKRTQRLSAQLARDGLTGSVRRAAGLHGVPEPEPAPLTRGALLWGAVRRGVRAKTLAPDPERAHILRLVCPAGVQQGDPLTFEGHGQELACEAPEGVQPGEEFEIKLAGQ